MPMFAVLVKVKVVQTHQVLVKAKNADEAEEGVSNDWGERLFNGDVLDSEMAEIVSVEKVGSGMHFYGGDEHDFESVLERIEVELVKIAKCAPDDDVAHSHEDVLHQEVLKVLQENAVEFTATEISMICERALKSSDIEFSRWYT